MLSCRCFDLPSGKIITFFLVFNLQIGYEFGLSCQDVQVLLNTPAAVSCSPDAYWLGGVWLGICWWASWAVHGAWGGACVNGGGDVCMMWWGWEKCMVVMCVWCGWGINCGENIGKACTGLKKFTLFHDPYCSKGDSFGHFSWQHLTILWLANFVNDLIIFFTSITVH